MTEPIPSCLAGREKHASVDRGGKPWSLRLCQDHFDRAGKLLHSIETEIGDLDAAPSIAAHWNTGGGGNSGGGTPKHEKAPVRLDAVAHSDPRRGDLRLSAWSWNDSLARDDTMSAVDVLHYWANRVRKARKIALPVIVVQLGFDATGKPVTDEELAPADVHEDRVLLSRQLDFVAEQVWVGDFFRAMSKLLSQLQHANGTAPEKPIPGRCPAQPTPGQECGGPLWPTKPVYTSEQSKEEEWTGHAPSAIRCSSCGNRWQGGRQIALLWLTLEQAQRNAEAS